MTADEFSQLVMHRTGQRFADRVNYKNTAPGDVPNAVRDFMTPIAAEVVNEIIESGARVTAAMLWAVPFRFYMPRDPETVVRRVTPVPGALEPDDGHLHLVPEFAP